MQFGTSPVTDNWCAFFEWPPRLERELPAEYTTTPVMGKKSKGNSAEKAMAKAAKKAKQEKSAQKKAMKDQRKAEDRVGSHQSKPKQGKKDKQGKQKKKGKDDEEDLDALLEQFKKDWEQDHQVQEERQSGPPSRRANATLTACPLGTDLWLFGGEYFDGERYVCRRF